MGTPKSWPARNGQAPDMKKERDRPPCRDAQIVRPSTAARWTGEAGDAAGARDQYAALLPVYERVLGPKHSDTLATRANLAHWGEKAEA